jgi:LysR family transcriptional regulator, regulator of gene expression of beta-lactamase
MDRAHLPLNALRAFEAAARHLSFTRAADELCVTQAAISQQVKALEDRLGVTLFRRSPRHLALTDEAQALLPLLSDAFDRVGGLLARLEAGLEREVLTVGAVGTFAVRWLIPRLDAFRAEFPFVDLRLLTHDNKVDLATERWDMAIRFGGGDWPGLVSERILATPMTPLCAPALARRIDGPDMLAALPLLRSFRRQEWDLWFRAMGTAPPIVSGMVFDSLALIVQCAVEGHGVAIAPPALFQREIAAGQLVQPFTVTVDAGSYWLTRLRQREPTRAMAAFQQWCLAQVG